MWYSPSLQQLRFLETILEEGSLARAASRLHTTHSTLSRSLRTLTHQLGINLFDRTVQGLVLNDSGRIYCTQIRVSLQQARLAFDLARYEAALHERPYYVGHSPFIHGGILPILQRLSLPGNNPTITLKSCSTSSVVSRVRHGELRIGLGILPIVDKNLWIERVASESFCLAIPASHRFATKNRLSLREVSSEVLIWMPRETQPLLYKRVKNYLITLGFNIRRFIEADTMTQALDFTACGAGVALLPLSATRFQLSNVIYKPVTDALIRIETGLIARKDRLDAMTKEFITTSQSVLRILE